VRNVYSDDNTLATRNMCRVDRRSGARLLVQRMMHSSRQFNLEGTEQPYGIRVALVASRILSSKLGAASDLEKWRHTTAATGTMVRYMMYETPSARRRLLNLVLWLAGFHNSFV